MADWFAEWAEHHATLFGMDGEKELETLLSWREVFLGQGFSRAELFAASNDLAASPPVPRFRNEHLDRLQRAVLSRRRETLTQRREAEAAFASEQIDCRLCHGCGWVSVPHPRDMVGGEWLGRHTLSVICRCPVGRLEQQRNEDFASRPRAGENRCRPKAFIMDEYEGHCPGWEAEVARKEAADRAVRDAKAAARDVDRQRGRLPGVEEVLGRYRRKP